MENNEQQILDEIKSMMASIRQQIELLDTKMAELQRVTLQSGSDPIELDVAAIVDDDLPFDAPEMILETVDDTVVESAADTVVEQEPEPDEEPAKVQDAEPAVELEELPEPVMVQMEEPAPAATRTKKSSLPRKTLLPLKKLPPQQRFPWKSLLQKCWLKMFPRL